MKFSDFRKCHNFFCEIENFFFFQKRQKTILEHTESFCDPQNSPLMPAAPTFVAISENQKKYGLWRYFWAPCFSAEAKKKLIDGLFFLLQPGLNWLSCDRLSMVEAERREVTSIFSRIADVQIKRRKNGFKVKKSESLCGGGYMYRVRRPQPAKSWILKTYWKGGPEDRNCV